MPEVLLDTASVHGLLRMAADEGLLRDREDCGDRFLYGLQQRVLPEWHRQQILEQVILNSRIHTLGRIPVDWLEGELLALGLVCRAEASQASSSENPDLSAEVIEGMLRALGYERPFADWVRAFERFEAARSAAEAFQRIHPGANMEPFDSMIRATHDDEYRDTEQYRLCSECNMAWNEVHPLASVVEEYLSLSECASRTTRYLKTPVYHMSANLYHLPLGCDGDNPSLSIYRIVTSKLGVIPVCHSLTETLGLSMRDDTVALRYHIDEWLASLDGDSADATSRIQRDIERASVSLARGKSLSAAGTIMGYMSIPASIAGIVNPLLGAVGLGLSCVGVVCDQIGQGVADRVRWVAFGSHPGLS